MVLDTSESVVRSEWYPTLRLLSGGPVILCSSNDKRHRKHESGLCDVYTATEMRVLCSCHICAQGNRMALTIAVIVGIGGTAGAEEDEARSNLD